MVQLVVRETGPLVSSFGSVNARFTMLWCSVLRACPDAALAIGSHRRVLLHHGYIPYRGH